MPYSEKMLDQLEQTRQMSFPNLPQNVYLDFENFLFFIGLSR